MNTQDLIGLVRDNIDNITEVTFIQKVLSMNNNLIAYDALNRILIYLQSEKAFDVRSLEDWELQGRKVNVGSKPIWIMLPSYETKYVHSEDEGKEADIHDLNIMELNKAIEINLIKRKSIIKELKTFPVYDIRQTHKATKAKFEVSKPILNHTELTRIFQEISGCAIEINDEYWYSTSENILFIPKEDYKAFANKIAKSIAKYFLEVIDTSNYTKEYRNLTSEYIEYSMSTLFRGSTSNKFSECSNFTDMIQIFSIIDGIVEKITNKIEYTGHINIRNGAAQSVDILKKAEVVLDILTAVTTNSKLNGT